MKINFIRGKIDLQNLRGADILVCPTDNVLSGTGKLEKAIREAAGFGLTAELSGKKPEYAGYWITGGHNLGVSKILHIPVPHISKAKQEPDCLRKAYRKALAAPPQTRRHVAVSLLGTGGAGWTCEASMAALWQEILQLFDPQHFAPLQVLDIYYPEEATLLAYNYEGRASQAFFSVPEKWGKRGDLYLWYAMMHHFDNPKFNRIQPRDFIADIQRYFHSKAATWLCGETDLFLQEFAHGGMTSGMISSFFAHRGIPLLVSNLVRLGCYYQQEPAFLIPVELRTDCDTLSLTLPYELLPLLTHLRSPREQMNDTIRYSLDLQNRYFVTVHHHKYFPDLIDYYTLDVEDAYDRHYRFSEAAAQTLIQRFHEHPKALIRGMMTYLKNHGGMELEHLVRSVSDETISY